MLLRPIIIVISLSCLAGWMYFSHLSWSVAEQNFLGKKRIMELAPEKAVTSIVAAHEDRLAQVRIVMGQRDLWMSETLTLSVRDETCSTVIRTSTLRNLRLHRQGPFVNFDFPEIEASQGQQYCIKLVYASPYKRKDRPTAVADKHENGNAQNERLQLRLSYGQPSAQASAQKLDERLSQYKPAWAKGHILALGFAGWLIAGMTIVRLWRPDPARARHDGN